MNNPTVEWDGWVYIAGKRYYWKERHNSKFKNNREKVIITQKEFQDAAIKHKKIFN